MDLLAPTCTRWNSFPSPDVPKKIRKKIRKKSKKVWKNRKKSGENMEKYSHPWISWLQLAPDVAQTSFAFNRMIVQSLTGLTSSFNLPFFSQYLKYLEYFRFLNVLNILISLSFTTFANHTRIPLC